MTGLGWIGIALLGAYVVPLALVVVGLTVRGRRRRGQHR